MAELVQIHYPYVWDLKKKQGSVLVLIWVPLFGGGEMEILWFLKVYTSPERKKKGAICSSGKGVCSSSRVLYDAWGSFLF